jgi:hypothetical protein
MNMILVRFDIYKSLPCVYEADLMFIRNYIEICAEIFPDGFTTFCVLTSRHLTDLKTRRTAFGAPCFNTGG